MTMLLLMCAMLLVFYAVYVQHEATKPVIPQKKKIKIDYELKIPYGFKGCGICPFRDPDQCKVCKKRDV